MNVDETRSTAMFDNVVVGIAEVEAGRDALALARQLASGNGTLTLVTVEQLVLGEQSEAPTAARAAAGRHALEELEALREEAHAAAVVRGARARSVATGLHDAVRDGGDLLVIGASRRDDYERMFLGDDTRDVLDDPPRPVAVAPVGYASRVSGLQRIGVAYDGSTGAARAVAVARELAREWRAELSAFEAVPEPVQVRDPWNPDPEIAQLVADARERVAALGGVTAEAGAGDPAGALAGYAATVDLIVVGAHEHRPLDRLSEGSTAQRLAAVSPSPVLVLAAST
jgi:nucleotide-binding universal stress UspA family protein